MDPRKVIGSGKIGAAIAKQLISFAGIPSRFQDRMLYLMVSSRATEPGFVVCGRVSVLVVPKNADRPSDFWPEDARPIHVLRPRI